MGSSKKRIGFYTQPQWAFGSIHSVLCKEVYKYDIDADIVDWDIGYSYDEWQDIKKVYDVFVTTPGNSSWVLTDFADIPYNRIICIAHARSDLVDGLNRGVKYNEYLDFACVSPSLKEACKDLGITREPKILRNGIKFDRFYKPIAQNLNVLGYAGAPKFHFEDCKRSHLAQEIAQTTRTCLKFAVVNGEQKKFIYMPDFYSGVDAVIVTSTAVESCGLPLMEGAAAGRLPISARIGITKQFDNSPGVILPLEDKEFVQSAIEKIFELQDNPVKFRQLCQEAQNFAYENYDWRHVVEKWVEVLNV